MNSAIKSFTDFGKLPDRDIDLAETSLLLASLFHPDKTLDRYRHHIRKLCEAVAQDYETLLKKSRTKSLELRYAALKHILTNRYHYEGDFDRPEHIQNADMIRVIDRGKGHSMALAILYLHVAQAQDWECYGLDFSGYFIVRLEKDGKRLLFDPFHHCKILQAPDLRHLVKQIKGADAELSSRSYEPLSRRALLVGLQNHIKLRQIETEDYAGALQSVLAMRALAPQEFRLQFDAGILFARTGNHIEAITALEDYITKAPHIRDRQEAQALLSEIRAMPESFHSNE
ncbi:MAG: hypothetical protein CO093_01020 [Alphaproteobacteria bacterium CG_4_9_14_3_um_filter_47_13]|nr:MAG: hypothetical protein CO093_01020 [Alphaproteobacteria bacterium CG_4_9_14_3_um_filter_47_13]